MKLKVLAYVVLIFFIIPIQTIIFEHIKIAGVKPNLLLVFLVLTVLTSNNVDGPILGYLCGFIQDCISGKLIGVYSLLGLCVGIGLNALRKVVYIKGILATSFIVFVSTVVYEFFVYLIHVVTIGGFNFGFAMRRILYESIYNFVTSLLLYVVVVKLGEWYESNPAALGKY